MSYYDADGNILNVYYDSYHKRVRVEGGTDSESETESEASDLESESTSEASTSDDDCMPVMP